MGEINESRLWTKIVYLCISSVQTYFALLSIIICLERVLVLAVFDCMSVCVTLYVCVCVCVTLYACVCVTLFVCVCVTCLSLTLWDPNKFFAATTNNLLSFLYPGSEGLYFFFLTWFWRDFEWCACSAFKFEYVVLQELETVSSERLGTTECGYTCCHMVVVVVWVFVCFQLKIKMLAMHLC